MNIFSLFIFGIVLLMYLHIFYQLKTGNDKEIYEVTQNMTKYCDEYQSLSKSKYYNTYDKL